MNNPIRYLINPIEYLIIVFVGCFILSKSFNRLGFKKYNRYSVWGNNEEIKQRIKK